ncbi:MAG: hypothetical protein ACRDGL_01790 [Candidatus Limnocylindrales bacterium]
MTDPQPPFPPLKPGTHGSPERSPRTLDGPLSHVALAAEAASLRAERAYVEGDRNARTLAKDAWFRLTLVALRPEAAFEEADQRGVLALQALEGEIELAVDGRALLVAAGELVVIGAGQPWRARSTSEALLLIHLAWPPMPGDAS